MTSAHNDVQPGLWTGFGVVTCINLLALWLTENGSIPGMLAVIVMGVMFVALLSVVAVSILWGVRRHMARRIGEMEALADRIETCTYIDAIFATCDFPPDFQDR